MDESIPYPRSLHSSPYPGFAPNFGNFAAVLANDKIIFYHQQNYNSPDDFERMNGFLLSYSFNRSKWTNSPVERTFDDKNVMLQCDNELHILRVKSLKKERWDKFSISKYLNFCFASVSPESPISDTFQCSMISVNICVKSLKNIFSFKYDWFYDESIVIEWSL